MACPITCPPKTRCQLVFGLLPRNMFTSIGSRSRMEIRSIRLCDIDNSAAAGAHDFRKFVLPLSTHLSRTSESHGHWQIYNPRAAFRLKFLDTTCGLRCRNFKRAALALAYGPCFAQLY